MPVIPGTILITFAGGLWFPGGSGENEHLLSTSYVLGETFTLCPHSLLEFSFPTWEVWLRLPFGGEGNEVSNLMAMPHLAQEYPTLQLTLFPLGHGAPLDVCKSLRTECLPSSCAML